jgi:peptide/nickel transport system substrate-binding protein
MATRRQLLGLITLAVIVALVAASCGNGTKQDAGGPSGGGVRNGGVYRTALDDFGFTAAFDPTAETILVASNLYGALLRNLVSYKHTAGAAGNMLHPDLAQMLPQVSSDGLTYTFKLKPNIRFGPPVNRVITSKDVEYAFERINLAKLVSGFGFYFFGVIKGMDGKATSAKPISGIETPDDTTIIFHLTRPTGDFLYRLAMAATAPMPREVAGCFNHTSGAYGRDVVSSGPYMIAGADRVDASSCATIKPMSGFDPSKKLILVRNPNYDPATDTLRGAYLDGIDIRIDSNVNDIYSKIESGALDGSLAGSQPKSVLRAYLTNPAKRRYLHANQGDRIFALPMNLTVPPFDDLHVRKAVNFVVDKAALLQALGGPVIGQIATHIMPPTLLNNVLGGDYDPYAAPGQHGDVGKAKDEMRQSRYDRDHDGTCDAPQCANLIMVNRNTEPWISMEPIVAQSLDKIGIKVTPRELAPGALFTALGTVANNLPIALGVGWIRDYPDAYPFAVGFSARSILPVGNSNPSLLGLTRLRASELGMAYPTGGVPSVDADIDTCEQIAITDPNRNQCWANLDKKLMEQVVPWVPYLWANALTVTAPTVTRYDFDQYAGEISLTQIAVNNGLKPRP